MAVNMVPAHLTASPDYRRQQLARALMGDDAGSGNVSIPLGRPPDILGTANRMYAAGAGGQRRGRPGAQPMGGGLPTPSPSGAAAPPDHVMQQAGMSATNNPAFTGGQFQRQGERPPEMMPWDNPHGWNMQGGDTGIYQPQAVPPAGVNDPGMQFVPEQLPPPSYMPGAANMQTAAIPPWLQWPQFGGGNFNSNGPPFGGGFIG